MKTLIKWFVTVQLIVSLVAQTSDDFGQKDNTLAAKSLFTEAELFKALDHILPKIKTKYIKELSAYKDVIDKELFLQILYLKYPEVKHEGVAGFLYKELNDKEFISKEKFFQILDNPSSDPRIKKVLGFLDIKKESFQLQARPLFNLREEGLLEILYKKHNKGLGEKAISKEDFFQKLDSIYPNFKEKGFIELMYAEGLIPKEDFLQKLSSMYPDLEGEGVGESMYEKYKENSKAKFIQNLDSQYPNLRDEGLTEFLYKQVKKDFKGNKSISKEELFWVLDRFIDKDDRKMRETIRQKFKQVGIDLGRSKRRLFIALDYCLREIKKDEELLESILEAYETFKKSEGIATSFLEIEDFLHSLDVVLNIKKSSDEKYKKWAVTWNETPLLSGSDGTAFDSKKEIMDSLSQVFKDIQEKHSIPTEKLFQILDSAVLDFKKSLEGDQAVKKESPQPELRVPQIMDINIHSATSLATSI